MSLNYFIKKLRYTCIPISVVVPALGRLSRLPSCIHRVFNAVSFRPLINYQNYFNRRNTRALVFNFRQYTP